MIENIKYSQEAGYKLPRSPAGRRGPKHLKEKGRTGMNLQNMRIGKRLVGGFAVFTCIIVILCIISFKNTTDTNTNTKQT